METKKHNPNDILEGDIDPSMDEDVPLDDTLEKMMNKHRSKLEPKNVKEALGNES